LPAPVERQRLLVSGPRRVVVAACQLDVAEFLDAVGLAEDIARVFIPVLGVFSGAVLLQEPLYWQDWTAIALIVVAIASVHWPTRGASAASPDAKPAS
jgi:hypothetical protein